MSCIIERIVQIKNPLLKCHNRQMLPDSLSGDLYVVDNDIGEREGEAGIDRSEDAWLNRLWRQKVVKMEGR